MSNSIKFLILGGMLVLLLGSAQAVWAVQIVYCRNPACHGVDKDSDGVSNVANEHHDAHILEKYGDGCITCHPAHQDPIVPVGDCLESDCHNGNDIPADCKPDVWCHITPDVTVIPKGSTLYLQATITNDSDQAWTVFAFSKVTRPNGRTYPYYFFGPVRAYLEPYQSKFVSILQDVPSHVPVGTYTYHGYVGTLSPLSLGVTHQYNLEIEVTE